MTRASEDLRLDGNAAAGLLGEIFAFETTSAITVCDGCGRASPVGALALYGQEVGAVLRCPGCDHVLIVVTRPHGDWCLDLRGVRSLRVTAAGAASRSVGVGPSAR